MQANFGGCLAVPLQNSTLKKRPFYKITFLKNGPLTQFHHVKSVLHEFQTYKNSLFIKKKHYEGHYIELCKGVVYNNL